MNVHTQSQPDFADFVPRFLKLLFDEEDRVVVCQNHPVGNWVNTSLPRPKALAWLSDRQKQPNLYFRASSHDGSCNFGKGNCIAARAIFADIDYGIPGHKKTSLFHNLEEVMAYVLTAPVRPSLVWATGHGVQVAYLLSKPFRFLKKPEAESANLIDRYNTVGKNLVAMLRADSAFTPEHAYRVPLTLNRKAATPDVWGKLLFEDLNQRYDFDELDRKCAGYGIEDLLQKEQAAAEAAASTKTPAAVEDPHHLSVTYEELPVDLRNEIGGGGERSERLFGIIGKMVRSDYSDDCIRSAVAKGADFVEKYRRRSGGLQGEVTNCLSKLRKGRGVYPVHMAPPFQVCNLPIEVPLLGCDPLSPELDKMLDRYAEAAGITLLGRVRDAARFHEHAFQAHPSGVLESPCGAGKSVWALCHTALHASDSARYFYVVETVEALYRAADMLEQLTKTSVGRVHGFNETKCHELCGGKYTWRECSLSNPGSPCHSCKHKEQCSFFTRREQLKRPILCLAHNGFIGMLEKDDPVLKGATVIIDEDLSQFSALSLSFKELDLLAKHYNRESVAAFFPCTSVAHADELKQWQTNPEAKAFAARNYIYCDKDKTTALVQARATLKQALSQPTSGGSLSKAKKRERADETIMKLLNFFRPSAGNDATYAYREGGDQKEAYVQAVRSRFDFGTQRSYSKLWILNASAQLSPHPYPDNLPVYTCPELPGNSNFVRLHVVVGNPTKTRQAASVWLSRASLRYGILNFHEKALLALDKSSDEANNVRDMLTTMYGPQCQGYAPEIVELRRGRIKGVNNAGDCTLALLTAMATFTGLDDCALHAALHYRRTFSDTPYVFTTSGSPNWPGGMMKLGAMRTYYALRSLDELYQSIWRTAVRNDHYVEAVGALPDAHWLTTLYRTVMPNMHVASAYQETTEKEKKTAKNNGQPVYDFIRNELMYGTGELLSMPPGMEVTKRDVATRLGYAGNRAWERNKPKIMALLGDFFEEGSTINMLRRTAK